MAVVAGERSWFGLFVLGVLVGIILYELLDPPPPELVNAIAESRWALSWADKYIGEDVPKEEREKLVKEMARYIARKLAEKIAG